MARKRGSSGSFPGWATPMTEPKIHKTDPMVNVDNGVAYPKPPNPMGWPIAGKTKGYNINTGGVRNSGRVFPDGRSK